MGDHVLRTLLDTDRDGDVSRFSPIVVDGRDFHLTVAESVVAIERLNRVLVAAGEALAVTAMSKPQKALRLEEHALADRIHGEVVVACHLQADNVVNLA